MPRAKAPAWTAEERAVLIEIYPREGLQGVTDLLPERSWQAIYVMAHKLGLQSPTIANAPEAKLQGDTLEEAIRLREAEHWSFARIGAHLGVSEASACNAVLIALCPRKGFTPAQRDEHGRLLPQGLERLRYMLRKGLKGVDIQLRLGLSAGRIAEERRRYNADLKARGKALLPPPGAGEAYSGVKLAPATKRAVEALLMQGLGSLKISERTGVSKTSIGRVRSRLVKRLARKGECVPGCDITGRRGAAIESAHYIPADTIADLRRRILAGEPVIRVARDLGVGGSSAYKIRDALAAELAERGETLPKPRRAGRHEARIEARKSAWLPKGMIHRYRRMSIEHGAAKAKEMLIAEIAAERRAEAARPKTFEEQLARIAAGAKLVPAFKPRRAEPSMTLGGIATGAL